MNGELIGSMPIAVWAALKAGSVPDSLRASREWMVHAQRVLGISDPSEAAIQLEKRMSKRGPSADWDATDFQRVRGEYAFAWNWCKAGAPIFNLTHSTAALLSMTRAPAVDFDHAPFPAFLICVPHVYLPLLSDRAVPVRWIAVQSGILMGAAGGLVMTIPDSDTLSNVVGVGPDGRLTEDGLPLCQRA